LIPRKNNSCENSSVITASLRTWALNENLDKCAYYAAF
jgi:hypothetical protein